MLTTPGAVNQPLREKLEAWRAQKQTTGAETTVSCQSSQKAAPTGAWSRSVPTVRRNNLILKASDPSKPSNRFAKKDPKDNQEDSENKSLNIDQTKIPVFKKEKLQKEEKDGYKEKDKELKRLRQENKSLKERLRLATETCNEAITRGNMAVEEMSAANFLNDILQQKNLELDCKISSERMNVNEHASERSRKHRTELERVRSEKEAYEKMADDLIAQMNEQMQQLQTVAMDRIADLEQQLMEEQSKTSLLEQTIRNMKQKVRNDEHTEEDEEEDEDDGSSTCSSTDTVNKSDDGDKVP